MLRRLHRLRWGGVFSLDGYRFSLTLFQRNGSNMIDWVRAAPTDPWVVQNIANLETRGVEVGIDLFPTWFMQHSSVERIQLNYSWIESDRSVADYESKYALNHLRHQALVNLNHLLPFGIRQSWRVSYKDRINADDYITVDTRISRKINSVDIFLSATNLFDSDYEEIGSVKMPGRWIKGGVGLRLE